MTKPSAKIILDSISPLGHRLTTMEVTMHRFVLAEFNTHRVFSRNSASSRAIPIEKRIQSVLEDPAMPLEWGSNKPGMQAGEELNEHHKLSCQNEWYTARNLAVDSASRLMVFGLHKQIANRLLEPFLWHTALVSSTEWENFFKQRATPICKVCNGVGVIQSSPVGAFDCHTCDGTGKLKSLAQPEIVAVADAMRDALANNKPDELKMNQWHLPYAYKYEMQDNPSFNWKLISAARCARVSYKPFDEDNLNPIKDLELASKMIEADPPHMSPFEHVATPWDDDYNCENGCVRYPPKGNFTGWTQSRHLLFKKG